MTIFTIESHNSLGKQSQITCVLIPQSQIYSLNNIIQVIRESRDSSKITTRYLKDLICSIAVPLAVLIIVSSRVTYNFLLVPKKKCAHFVFLTFSTTLLLISHFATFRKLLEGFSTHFINGPSIAALSA